MQCMGYGTEAIQLMLELAFEKYEMNCVSIGVVGLNSEAISFYNNRIQTRRYTRTWILLQ